MKKKYIIVLLVGIVITLITLIACTPANNKNIQKVSPIDYIQTQTFNGSLNDSYFVYKVKIEETEYYLVSREGRYEFTLIPISKSNSTTEIKDPYWNW